MKYSLASAIIIIGVIALAIFILPNGRTDVNMKEHQDIRSLQAATSVFILENSYVPPPKEMFDILLDKKLLTKIPRDSWGNEYQYSVPGPSVSNGFSIYSKGPNGLDEKCRGDDICLDN